MKKTYFVKDYKSILNIRDTQFAIKEVKDFFERKLGEILNLTRVSAPLFVMKETGLNDNLTGVEKPVSFNVSGVNGNIEIVQSLAKWKRFALKKYNFEVGEGIYTDMNAIRKDEDTDNIHSIFVDQWDWEKIISKEDRNKDFLKEIVNKIYDVLKQTEDMICKQYPAIEKILPDKITFVESQELEDLYPNLSSKEREYKFTRDHGAIFVIGVGKKLKSGKIHDDRAPDYDDWDLNGDILVYYPVIDCALELSSMGIRVDEKSLKNQLIERNMYEERANLPFQKALLNGELPLTIGGGIGQSRMCMFFLKKAHIGEVQSSTWDDDNTKYAKLNNIELL